MLVCRVPRFGHAESLSHRAISRWFLFPHFYCYRTSSLGQRHRAELLYVRVRIETTELHRSPLAVTAIAATGLSLSVLRRQADLAKPSLPTLAHSILLADQSFPRPAARRRELGRPVRLAPPWMSLAPRGRATAVPRHLPFGAQTQGGFAFAGIACVLAVATLPSHGGAQLTPPWRSRACALILREGTSGDARHRPAMAGR